MATTNTNFKVKNGLDVVADITASTAVLTNAGAVGNLVLAVSGASGQTGDLQQWSNSGTKAKVGAQGNFVIGGSSTLGMLSVYSDGTTRVGQVIRGFSGQTADLLQIQNSTPNTLFKVDQNGFMVAGGATVLSNALISSSIYGTTQVGIAVRGTAGQTADLQQWQTSTPTTVARIDSGGNLKASNVATLNSLGQMAESNSGALFVMGRATTQAASPGLNYGTLYFRDGTTSGTLKLATRTGASGVEETIVDNLSSTGSTAGAQFVGAGGVNTAGTVTATGNISTGGVLKSTASSGDEGGQIDLTKSVTNTTLTTGISIDVFQNKLRFFETGGTNRGYYIDITTGGAGVATNLVGGGSFTGGTLTSNLTLAAGTTSLSPLTFQSGTNLTTVTAGAMEYDGTVFYQTSNTNPGRALDTQQYYYASSSDYGPDFTASGAAKSMLGGATTGITVAAGTTYEFELYTTVQHQYITNTGVTGTYTITSTTVSGSPTVAFVQNVDYGSNTTNFTTATTLSRVRTTSSVTFSAAISSGSRYNFLQARGIIRVTGTGTAKIYPSLATSQVGASDNIWTVQSGTVFKLTPIGNGTATTVGTWA